MKKNNNKNLEYLLISTLAHLYGKYQLKLLFLNSNTAKINTEQKKKKYSSRRNFYIYFLSIKAYTLSVLQFRSFTRTFLNSDFKMQKKKKNIINVENEINPPKIWDTKQIQDLRRQENKRKEARSIQFTNGNSAIQQIYLSESFL